jgi:hypothetical protein
MRDIKNKTIAPVTIKPEFVIIAIRSIYIKIAVGDSIVVHPFNLNYPSLTAQYILSLYTINARV